MVDVHSHIIWGVDDGPGTIEESLAMLQAADAGGTTDIVATPHANPRYSFDRALSQQRIQALTEATSGRPKIHLGCEFHFSFDNIDRLMEALPTYTINAKQYLLVECPDFQIGAYTETVLQRLLDSGIVPIVAHPERNPILREKLSRVESWVELGCLVQLTALSITGGFGGSAKTASMRLIERGLAHIVASDAHDPINRHPVLREAHQAVSSRLGEDVAELLLVDNPRAVVEGAPVPGGKQSYWEQPAPWYQFWKGSN
jgi:protein-tyrosine phosphatase